MIEALEIQVRGIVQGVGFRPFIYRLARKCLIKGWVLNASDGVFIHAEGEAKHLDEFIIEISESAPAAAHVSEIEMKEVPLENFEAFEIRFSHEGAVEKTTLVSPDLATCKDCVQELFDKEDRRYRYPFINCTNCGPRFTVINALPYDRANTSMKDFSLCAQCHSEYNDPLDRRFHAQPDACFECGPRISWRLAPSAPSASAVPAASAVHSAVNQVSGLSENNLLAPRQSVASNTDVKAAMVSSETDIIWGNTLAESDAILAEAVTALREGKIVAVKGLGGFHLVCDAANETALATLRDRKRRKGQAFAVMLESVDAVDEVCEVNAAEKELLTGSPRPIVLLKKRPDASFAVGLADGLNELGVMLPYTPLQHLLMHDFGGMLVMTSANIHDEPIVTDDEEAYRVLGTVADAFLGNDRVIESRYDDSVIRVIRVGESEYSMQFIRRARGYAPLPLALPKGLELKQTSIFATGPEQKNTFCLTRGEEVFVSQHVGDMENAETFDAWLATKKRYEELFKITPQEIACDMHPEYLTTKWAQEQKNADKVEKLIEVQHHHAHVVSVMAENELEGPLAGFAFDGTGYGVDGAIWGGEVLLSNLQAYERFANFVYIPMPGGAAAIKHPLRMAYGTLWAFDLLEHPQAQQLIDQLGETAKVCERMIEGGINTPMTSSVGRLFDAVSAILGICTEPRYEGEGAVLLEAAIIESEKLPEGEVAEAYSFEVLKNTATAESTAEDTSVLLIDMAPTFAAVLDDLQQQIPVGIIARKFHDALVDAMLTIAQTVYAAYEIQTFALSGGVFMNRYLVEHAVEILTAHGFTVALNKELPPGDGGVSYGQAVVALALKQ